MEVFRRHTDYALRSVLCLATVYPEHLAVRSICRQAFIPYAIACKLMQKLSRAEIVVGIRGLHGGYTLSHSAEYINVLQVIQAIQGPIRLNKCIKSKKNCPRQDSCVVGGFMVEVQQLLDSKLEKTTLQDLLDRQ